MDKTLEALALEIDAAEDGNISSLNTLLNKCSNGLETATGQNRAIFRFFEANCYSVLAIMRSREPDYEWSWQQGERISEILSLRKAVLEQGFSELEPIFQCKILTNLGNRLNSLGRFVEAIKYWDAALAILPNFAMALGNKGVGLIYYGQSLYDYSHKGILTAYAMGDLNNAISKGALWDSGSHPEAKDHFKQYYDGSVKHLKDIEYNFDFDLDQWPLGESDEDIDYRGWCLHHQLFLSPLNDVCRYTAAAQDVIHLPNHTYNINEDPRFPKYFNLLKQEYVTARYMLFEALNGESEHISDKDVLLLNGFDGVQFGYRSEQLKTAYRLAYSLFDKIALFLNDYFSVGLNASSVSFRRIWGETKNKQFELYPCFENSKNWPLRGLYYLSKDLFDEGFIDVSLPDAQELASLRNRIEHRFLSLQNYASEVENTDTHSYITIADFEEKTLRIISMAREALIYLALAMYREEAIRDNDKDSDKLSVPIQSMPIKRY
ncbi:MAG: hypothetical protein KAT90_13615 [Gammaproteobacteria bacterium]|nr:hypothetical protein [Gammaproteobacteria bacterium]